MKPPTVARIAVTPGEPAGIGPDVCVFAARRELSADLVVVADPDLIAARAALLGIGIELVHFKRDTAAGAHRPGTLTVLPVPLRRASTPGRLDPANAGYVLEALSVACDGCLDGTFDALVTGPVHKGVINDAGLPFTGHTEFLADRCRAFPVMMLAAPGLRVALATTHVPLADVSSKITTALLERVIQVMDKDLRNRFGIARPRILICGLNPHAGEGGHLGREEIEVIQPVLERLRPGGMDLIGPVPADTAFVPERLTECDAVLSMYHDQGLPVLKFLAFGRAVNITLGLPIIRTSVDHGTALDRAGTGRVETGSLEEAIAIAVDMAARRRA